MKDNLYIIRVYGKEGSLVKLGYSSAIDRRLYDYHIANPMCEVVGTYYRSDAATFERHFHSTFTSDVMNEWYSEDMLPVMVDSISNITLVDEHKQKVADVINGIDLSVRPTEQVVADALGYTRSYLQYYLKKHKDLIELLVQKKNNFYYLRIKEYINGCSVGSISLKRMDTELGISPQKRKEYFMIHKDLVDLYLSKVDCSKVIVSNVNLFLTSIGYPPIDDGRLKCC